MLKLSSTEVTELSPATVSNIELSVLDERNKMCRELIELHKLVYASIFIKRPGMFNQNLRTHYNKRLETLRKFDIEHNICWEGIKYSFAGKV